MPVIYPAQIDTPLTYPIVVNNQTPVNATYFNNVRQTIINIETVLGINPANGYGTVGNALITLQNAINNSHGVQIGRDLGGVPPAPLVIGIQGRPISSTQPDVGQVLTWDGLAWAPIFPSLDEGFAVTLGGPPTFVEIGQSLINPIFIATYNHTPTHGVIVDNLGNPAESIFQGPRPGDPLTTPPGNFIYHQSYEYNDYPPIPHSVNFLATINDHIPIFVTASTSVTWTQRLYYGVASPGGSTASFIQSLSNNPLAIADNFSFTVNAAPGQAIYFAYRSAYGIADFFVNGFEGGFNLISNTIPVTNAYGFTENYTLYQTSQVDLGITTINVFFPVATTIVSLDVFNPASSLGNLLGDVIGSTDSNSVIRIQGTPVSTNSVANDGYALVSKSGVYVPAGVNLVYNIKNFGAIGNDTFDNTISIQNAINAANIAGAAVYIPPGTYAIKSNNLVVPGNSVIFGDGKLSSIKLYNNHSVQLATLDQNFVFDRFEIQSADSSCTVALHLQANYFVTLRNMWITSHGTTFTTAGIQIEGTAAQNNNAQINIYDINIEGCTGDGVQIYDELGCAGVNFYGGNIADCDGYGLNQKKRGPTNGLSQFYCFGTLIEANVLGNVNADTSTASGLIGCHLENQPTATAPLVTLGNTTSGGFNSFAIRDCNLGSTDAPYMIYVAGGGFNFGLTLDGNGYYYTPGQCLSILKVISGTTIAGLSIGSPGEIDILLDIPTTVFGIDINLISKQCLVNYGNSSSNFDLTNPAAGDIVSLGAIGVTGPTGFFAADTLLLTGINTTAKSLIVPLNAGWEKTVINQTPARITVRGASGAGVPIAPNKSALVGSDGTNIIRITPDVPEFAPTDITGCVLWLTADTGITLNGNNVSRWKDRSGQGGDVTQSTPADQPAYNTEQINGYPTIVGDGVNDSLSGSVTYNTSTLTVFHVVKEDSSSVTHVSLALQGSGHNSNFGRLTNTTTYELADSDHFGDGPGAVTGTNGIPHILAGVYNGVSSTFYLDGVAGTTGTTGGFSEHLEVLGNPGGSGVFWAGAIAEVIIFNFALDDVQIATVTNYLGNKYGITVIPPSLFGDVVGPTEANTVVKIQGTPVSSASVANDGYALVSTSGQYVPTGVPIVFNVKNFGAKGNVITVTDAAITSGTSILTSSSATFTNSDIGKVVVVGGASLNQYPGTVALFSGNPTITGTGTAFSSTLMLGGTIVINNTTYSVLSIASDTSINVSPTPGTNLSGTNIYGPNKPLTSSILSINSSHSINLGTNATVSVTNATAQYGTDDALSFQSAANIARGTLYIPPGTYFIGTNITLPLPGTKVSGDSNGGTIVSATSSSLNIFTPQASDQRFENLTFLGQSVDSTSGVLGGQFAIKCISTKAVLQGNTASFGSISNADSFTITIDTGLSTSTNTTVHFQNTDTTGVAVINRINAAFGPGLYFYTANLSENGNAVYLYSASAGNSANISVSGNPTTLTKLGFSTTSASGTGNPAPRCRVKNCIFTGPDTSRALNNGIKLPDGCDDIFCEDLQWLRLAGSNGNSGAGYGILLANNVRAKIVNSTFFGSTIGGRHSVYVSGGCTKPIITNLHVYGSRSSSIHLFCHQSEPPTVGAIISNCHLEGQLLGEDDTAAIEFTGHIIDCQVMGCTIIDCSNNGVICSSYTYGVSSAPLRVQIIGTSIIRPGRNGIIFEGAQTCIAKQCKVTDASQQTINNYYPYTVVSNGNGGPTIANGCLIEECFADDSTNGTAVMYQQAIRFEPSSNGPTNCVARNNILDPGTGADGNGSFICFQSVISSPLLFVTLTGNQARTLQIHTGNNTAPSILGTNFFVINFSTPLPLNNLGGGYEGQEVTLVAANSNCEIQANSNFSLRDGINWSMTSGAWIRIRRYGSTDASGTNAKWYELGRSSGELYRTQDGSSSQASYGFANEPGLGMVRTGNHALALQSNSIETVSMSDQGIGFSPNGTLTLSADTTGVRIPALASTVLAVDSSGYIRAFGSSNFAGLRLSVTPIGTSYNVLTTDNVISVGSITGTITVTLPSSPATGDTFQIKDMTGIAATHNIIVSGNGNNIDNASTFTINSNYGSVTVCFTGSIWSII